MHPGRLSFFLLLTLMFPVRQVVRPQRDVNAEETVAANFLRLRQNAGITSVRRVEGAAFSHAACEAAEHGNPDKVWVEDAGYAAMIYSTAKPESTDAISSLATREWKADQHLVIGACEATTPAFPSGRYWIAVGIVSGASDKSVADLLGGRSVSVHVRPRPATDNGE